MIVVKVELWSAINGNVQQLALMSIDNIGGTQQLGDYRTRTYRGRDAEALARALVRETVQREGKVLRHPRLREHVWNLVAKALSGMGYGVAAAPSASEVSSELADATVEPPCVAALEAGLRLIDDMSRFVGQMSLRDYALLNEAPIAMRAAIAELRDKGKRPPNP